MSTHCHSLICLGDSYTIGESVALHAGFPYQTIQLLRSAGLHFHAPEIIAKTGYQKKRHGNNSRSGKYG